MSDEKQSAATDADAIRALAELLTETSLTEIEIERNGVRMRVARQVTQVHSASAAAATPAPANDATKREAAAGTVPSPMVGTVYVAPEPGAQPFVKIGDAVSEGDTLMIVEAMKTMNPILAPRDGVVTEICVHDSQPVEFGQALLILN